MKHSSCEILTSFNILSFAYEHFLSKLSPAMDMDIFWAYTDTTPHKHKTTDMAMCRLLFSRYLKGKYWVGTSLFNCLATSTKVCILTKKSDYLLSHPFFSVRVFTSIKTSSITKRVWKNGDGSMIYFCTCTVYYVFTSAFETLYMPRCFLCFVPCESTECR